MMMGVSMPVLLDNEGNRYFIGAGQLWSGDDTAPTPAQAQNLWRLSPHWRQIDTLPLPLWCAFALSILIQMVVAGMALTVIDGARMDSAILSAAFLATLACHISIPYAGRLAGRRFHLGKPLPLPLRPQIPRSWTEYAATYLAFFSLGLVMIAQTANKTAAGTSITALPLSFGIAAGLFVIMLGLLLPLWYLARNAR